MRGSSLDGMVTEAIMGNGIPEVRLLARYLNEDGEWPDGVRPPRIIETLDDAVWLAAHEQGLDVLIVCGYCGDEQRARSLVGATRWFLDHACAAEGEILDVNSHRGAA